LESSARTSGGFASAAWPPSLHLQPGATRRQQTNLASPVLVMASMSASLSKPGRRCSRSRSGVLSGTPWGTTQPLPPRQDEEHVLGDAIRKGKSQGPAVDMHEQQVHTFEEIGNVSARVGRTSQRPVFLSRGDQFDRGH
jgi:hypothetical protein